ncbi:MAG TPA: alpha/beta hydrolase [Gemmatimonadaceae bacterium]|nr:alpha/beta hydrolase [Gemmatimonadaceae bacterium]
MSAAARGPSDRPLSVAERIEGVGARLLDRLPGWAKVLLSGERAIVIDGQTLDPQIQLVRAIRRWKKVPGLCDPDLASARARYRRDAFVYRGPIVPVREARELAVDGAAGPLAARLYLPPVDTEPPALLVYYHGGGFVIGDLDTHDAACRILCRRSGVRVLAVTYRLAPEHPHPAAVDDACAAYRWARRHAGRLGVASARVAVGGDSAGGNLAAVVAREETRRGAPPLLQLLVYPSSDSATPRPARALFDDGFFLTARDEDEFMRRYVDDVGVSRHDPRVSPLLAIDLGGLPPAIVVTAGFDVLRDQGRAYAEALRDAGVPLVARHLPSLPHGFLHMTGVSRSAHHAVTEIGDALRALAITDRPSSEP